MTRPTIPTRREHPLVWHDSPFDEHPVADVSQGQDTIWQAVDAIAAAGLWEDTVFLLTWDDWGGFDDHVATPDLEHTLDGVQLAYGPRVPLLMFGGRVPAVIDSRWNSHVSVGRTVLDLLGLPPWACHGSIRPRHWPTPHPTPSAPPGPSQPVGPVLLRDGSTLPPPDDQPVT